MDSAEQLIAEEDKFFDQLAAGEIQPRLPEDHSGEELCETCLSKVHCEERRKTDIGQQILWAQANHCHCVVGRQDFHPDREWKFEEN